MDNYIKYIENLVLNNEPIIFQNSSSEHASAVMSSIFKYSKERVRILAGSLCGDVSSDEKYIQELRMFLNRNGKIQILLDDFNGKLNPAVANVLSDAYFFNPNQVEIRQTDKKVTNSANNQNIHFTVGDKKMFRLEEDTVKYFAKCSFNSPEISSILISSFDALFLSAVNKPVSVASLQG